MMRAIYLRWRLKLNRPGTYISDHTDDARYWASHIARSKASSQDGHERFLWPGSHFRGHLRFLATAAKQSDESGTALAK